MREPLTPGGQLWVGRYAGPGNGADDATAVGTSPDGTKVFVTGASPGLDGDGAYATVAYETSTGKQSWAARYAGPGNVADALGVSPDGMRVFVTGSSLGSGANHDYATLAYDASTGDQLWLTRYDASPFDYAYSLAVSPDGSKVFVTGEATNQGDYATIAYDASSGAQLWLSLYSGPADYPNAALSVTASPDGTKVFVTGWSMGTNAEFDYATVAYDSSTGAQLWASRYKGSANGNSVARSVKVSPDGTKVFVTGYSEAANGLADYATAAYDSATGAQLWVRRYNGPGNGDDEGTSVGVNSTGEVFVTGQSTGAAGNWDYVTIAYEGSTGAGLWLRRYDGLGHSYDQALALGMSPDGTQLFVTGLSVGSGTGEDFATLAYRASSGRRLWLRRWNSPLNHDDEANAIAVNPMGTQVFVTGTSLGSGDDWDYATIAYSTI